MEKVLVLYPESLDALTVSAGILDATGRKAEAREFYKRALAVEPESRHLRLSLCREPRFDRLAEGSDRDLREPHRRFPRGAGFLPVRRHRLAPTSANSTGPSPSCAGPWTSPRRRRAFQPGRGLREERRPQERGGDVQGLPREIPEREGERETRGAGRAREPGEEARRRVPLRAVSRPRSSQDRPGGPRGARRSRPGPPPRRPAGLSANS